MAIQQRLWLAAQLTPRKLTFYIFFYGFHTGIFALGWYLQASDSKLSGLNALTFSVWFSRGAGLCLSVDVCLILLPMCRNVLRIIRPHTRWLPLDETQFFHRQIAYSILIWTTVHVCAHYVNFFNVERSQIRPEAAVQIHYTEAGGITGHVMLLCMLIMYTTSHTRIRRQSFETFYYAHFLFVPFLLAMYTHATGCFVRDTSQPYSPFAGQPFWDHCLGYEGWRWELVSAAVYLGERTYREIQKRRPTHIIKVIKHPYDAVEVHMRKPSMRYKAGQWIYINVPAVSRGQWHPFTITSCPFDPYISIHVRQVGDFTRAFANALGAGPEQQEIYDKLDPLGIYEVALQKGQEMPELRIDGPYGAPAEDVFDNEIAILVGMGIGVTPWASILKNIWHLRVSENPPTRLKRVEFIWICQDTNSFEWFQALLSTLEAQSTQLTQAGNRSGSPGTQIEFLRIHTYLTQKMDADTAQNIVLHSVGAERDPLTGLSSRTKFGRPDFKKLFTAVRTGIQDSSYVSGLGEKSSVKVGVYFCGPNVAAGDIKEACRLATSPEVKFNFWKEHF